MAKPTTSEAKLKVIKFIENTKPGEQEIFKFDHEGDLHKAEKFIHRMRVELSRMRKYIRDRGKTIKAWKMIVVSIEKSEEKINHMTITLKRTTSESQEVFNQVDNILDELEGGNKLNVS